MEVAALLSADHYHGRGTAERTENAGIWYNATKKERSSMMISYNDHPGMEDAQ